MKTTSGFQTADSPRARTGPTQGGYANSYNDTSPCLAASWLVGGATSTSGSGLFWNERPRGQP
ncbi:rCG37063 [Rattus norvegicus]|uniref:RCG37063 n=1 Tax=Rattus norvegicus TaxID=10116 RepID=A6HUL1_RAT|nr:rCG37063 [Rattus norvegicus]